MQATAAAAAAAKEKKKKKLPRLEEFIQSRDFAGAITLLEVCSTAKSVFGGNPWQPALITSLHSDNALAWPHVVVFAIWEYIVAYCS